MAKNSKITTIAVMDIQEETESKTVDLSDLLSDEDKQLGYGGLRMKTDEVINVLLIGRTQSGKTALVEAFKNPRVGIPATGFSSTRNPKCHKLMLTNELDPTKSYHLNIIDTPGLKEVSRDQDSRSDSELIKFSTLCLQENMTNLNVVCFVSKAGNTNLYDAEVYDLLMEFLGPDFSECSMMILTNSDQFPHEDLNEFTKSIKEHKNTKNVYEYCKLGVFFSGIVHCQDLKTLRPAIQKEVLHDKLEKLEVYRKTLINEIIKPTHQSKQLHLLQSIKTSVDKIFKEAVEKEVRKMMDEQAKGKTAKSIRCTLS